jgi:dipeptidase
MISVALLLGFALYCYDALACTNILVTKGASVDGSTFISYAADSHDLYGELYHWQGRSYPAGTMLDIYEWDTGKYLGQIPQIAQTYTVIGNMNEHQLAIAETTFGGRAELTDTTGLIDYGSLIYIALQRAKTAREAIKVMTNLVDTYGYCSGGESFSIADPNEVWIMEMIGKGAGNKGAVWVAVKIPDGYVSAHANQARITTFPKEGNDVMYSKDAISFATENGYYKGTNKDFSFADAYAPLNYSAIRGCEARVWSAFRILNPEMDKYKSFILGESKERMPLYIKPTNKVSLSDVKTIMRDHFEDTPLDMTQDIGAGPYHAPYRWRPMTWKVNGEEYFNERAIATQQTGFSFVAQMRGSLPNAIGGILWFGVDDADMTVYVPMYMGMRTIPENYAVGNGNMLEFTWESSFWVFNWVANQAYHRYSQMIVDIRKMQRELESKFEMYTPIIDQAALALHKTDPEAAKDFLTEYSHTKASETHKKWKSLSEFLMVKYLDGNLHEEENGIFKRNPYGNPQPAKFPGYSKEFYENIVEKTGDRLKMK